MQKALIAELVDTVETRKSKTCRADIAKAVGKYVSTQSVAVYNDGTTRETVICSSRQVISENDPKVKSPSGSTVTSPLAEIKMGGQWPALISRWDLVLESYYPVRRWMKGIARYRESLEGAAKVFDVSWRECRRRYVFSGRTLADS